MAERWFDPKVLGDISQTWPSGFTVASPSIMAATT